MKVYVVESDFGQYDSAHTHVETVWDTREAAEKYAKETEEFYKNINETPAPMTEEEFESLFPSGDTNAYDEYEKDPRYNEYLGWCSARYHDFNFCRINEFELNPKL